MILSQRPSHSASHSISYPISSELAPDISSVPSRTTPQRGHKHTLSKPVWLGRNSSSNPSHSAPHAAPKPTRISEPKIGSSLELFNFQRSGPLGSGATIVRTPQEALFGPFRASEHISEEDGAKGDAPSLDAEQDECKPVPPSPPLPPLPDISDERGAGSSGALASILSADQVPQRGSSSSKSFGPHSSSTPTLVAQSRAPSSVPSLPADVDMSPPQPPFEAILLSPIPDDAFDPSKFIVTLETCTTTYRTSLRSLVSRPSHLSRYVTSLLSPTSETASVYSNVSGASSPEHSRSGFNSVFLDHLASSGCSPRSITNIHLFLDRPSAPYAHVLAYLRSLPAAAEQQETLPRAVRLDPGSGSISPVRLESLLELRDEASYLGLAELEQLCSHEIRRFRHLLRSPVTLPAPFPAAPVPAIGTLRGKTGSIHSFHTVVEEGRVDSATRKSGSSSSSETKDLLARERGRERRPVKYEVGTPPPGWI